MIRGIQEFMMVKDTNDRKKKELNSDQMDRLRIEDYKNNIF